MCPRGRAGEGLGRGTATMAASPVEPARPKMKGFYYKASLRPPGSFEVAFPDAAEKMRKVIMQLKEGKTPHLFPPGTDTMRKTHSRARRPLPSVSSPGGSLSHLRGGAHAKHRPFCVDCLGSGPAPSKEGFLPS